MDSLVAVLTRDPVEEYVALRVPGNPPANYGYREFVDTVWKTGNYFRRLGAHEGATVAIVDDASAAVPLSIFGAILNGATVRLDPPSEIEAKLLIAPGDRVQEYDLPPGAQRIAHSAAVDDPAVHSFGEGVWSENPFFPEKRVFVRDGVLADGTRRLAHEAVLERIEGVLERHALGPDDEVVLRAPTTDVRTIVAGVLAPLSRTAAVRFAPGEADAEGTVAIVSGDHAVPETRAIPIETV